MHLGFLSLVFWGCLFPCVALADLADDVIAQVSANVAKLKAADPEAVPLAFWDFDGTIIKGDVSEGLEENGKQLYKGLIQRTVEEGFSPVYAKETGWRQYAETDYPRLKQLGYWLAWPFNAQIYEGVESAKLDDFCRREFDRVYPKWYFRFSVKVFKGLAAAGVENYVISGSPEAFVRNAAASLGIPREHIRGIRVTETGGRMSTQLVYPMPFSEGKVENLREFVAAQAHGVAVAAFGNSYYNDAPFMRYVATQPALPGGAKGTAVMINGMKLRPGYEEFFIKTTETEVVGSDQASGR